MVAGGELGFGGFNFILGASWHFNYSGIVAGKMGGGFVVELQNKLFKENGKEENEGEEG